MNIFDYWVYVPDWKVAVFAPPKCASTSVIFTLTKHFHGVREYKNFSSHNWRKVQRFYKYGAWEAMPSECRKLAIVRDPVDRFTSLWSHHCRDHTPGGIPKDMRQREVSMFELLDFIESNLASNAHWCPLTRMIGGAKNVEYCLLEDVRAAWDEFMPAIAPPLEYENKTRAPQRMIPSSIYQRLIALYAKDVELINTLREAQRWAT